MENIISQETQARVIKNITRAFAPFCKEEGEAENLSKRLLDGLMDHARNGSKEHQNLLAQIDRNMNPPPREGRLISIPELLNLDLTTIEGLEKAKAIVEKKLIDSEITSEDADTLKSLLETTKSYLPEFWEKSPLTLKLENLKNEFEELKKKVNLNI